MSLDPSDCPRHGKRINGQEVELRSMGSRTEVAKTIKIIDIIILKKQET